jgi:hypothetical protein
MSENGTYVGRGAAAAWRLSIIILLALFALLVLFYTLNYQTLSSNSVEVGFTDASAHGLEIVPASCASAPPATGDSGGYVISGGVQGADVNANGDEFCVTNNTGNTMFLPTHSTSEMQSFINAAPNIGVTEGPPSSFPY